MTFSFACHHCGHVNGFELSQAGKSIRCGGCAQALAVPAPREAVAEPVAAATAPAVLRFACPSCGRKFSAKPALAGKKIRCDRCGAGVRVPGAAPEPAGAAMTAPWAGSSILELDPASSLLDDLASIEGAKRPRRAEAVLPSRTEAMEQVRQEVAGREAVKAQAKAEKARKQKKMKKRSGYFDPKETLKLVAGVCVFVGFLAFLAWGYPDFRFPLGGVLCIVGFIVYLIGLASLRQLVAEEGPFAALLFRFCPPYQWWFVLTRWSDAKDFVAFFGAGLVILTIGGVVIKSSPVGKEAMESERAYQEARRGGRPDAPTPIPNVPADARR